MKNYPPLFNEQKVFNGTLNAWEYYFNQPTNHTLEDAYSGKNVILG
jgi:hypothetical protein